jgi:hypothetical protein
MATEQEQTKRNQVKRLLFDYMEALVASRMDEHHVAEKGFDIAYQYVYAAKADCSHTFLYEAYQRLEAALLLKEVTHYVIYFQQYHSFNGLGDETPSWLTDKEANEREEETPNHDHPTE